MKTIRNPLTLALAIAAALAMPAAFAQEANTVPPTSETTTAPPTSTVDDAAYQSTAPAPAEQPQQLTWADVDTDGNGSISKDESSALPSLAQVFEQADGDSDGELTPDEYKAFVASNSSGTDGSGGID